ncbi:MAG: carboxypeptidase-like regulatory domain-containing protein, partial [Cytophagaceae bacterium]
MLLSPVGSLQGADANSMAVRVMAPKDKTVRGTVRDGGNNEGLPGVSVVLKGTQRGTTTDANGNFQIDV